MYNLYLVSNLAVWLQQIHKLYLLKLRHPSSRNKTALAILVKLPRLVLRPSRTASF